MNWEWEVDKMYEIITNKSIRRLPYVEINLKKIKDNVEIVNQLCQRVGIESVGVTKVSSGSLEIAQAMVEGGIKIIGDSRLQNLKRYIHMPVKKMLLRLPMLSEVDELVKYADVSLNSEINVIKAISDEAKKINKLHEIILMIEVGDLREGIYNDDEIIKIAKETMKLDGVKLIGVGTNLNCFGSINPTKKNIGRLVEVGNNIKRELGVELEIISGGNSGSISLIQNGNMPNEVNQLRIGTAFLFGLIEISLNRIPGTHKDAFKLITEIIEIKDKPSKPFGETGVDAFRNTPVFEDKGIRRRAICAVGKQDTDPQFMYPEDDKIEILGSSSDHLILDITDCNNEYNVGDKISFILDYVSLLRCMTSPYVSKVYT